MFELPLWQWVGVFALAGVVLVRAGIGLARAGDEIATRTGVGGLVVGVILVSMATSLPEIATDVSAAVAGAPDLAVGDLFGSSMANMAILAVVDLMRRRRVWQRVVLAQARAGSIAIALTALAVLGVATPEGFALGWVGADTALIFVAYVASVAWTRRSPDTARAVPAMAELPAPTGIGEAERPREPMRDAIRRFVLAAGVVLVTGPVVAVSARGISDTSGLGGTFVGVSLVAVSTSLPELSVSIAAVRIGAYDLAVGNLFGSNAVNMGILFIVDVAYIERPLLTGADPAQIVAGVGAIGLMAIAMAAIIHGEETRIARLEPDAVLLLVAYLGALAAVAAV